MSTANVMARGRCGGAGQDLAAREAASRKSHEQMRGGERAWSGGGELKRPVAPQLPR